MRLFSCCATVGLCATLFACVASVDHRDPLEPSDAGYDVDGADAWVDSNPSEDVVQDTAPDEPSDVESGWISLGYPCGHDAECQSGICHLVYDRPGGAVCTRPCTTQCPLGFSCVATATDDAMCVPDDLCVDVDCDGYGDGPGCVDQDCDDLNAALSPGYPERCDGVDNNCDGVVDNDVGAGSCVADALGVCAAGSMACVLGEPTCTPGEPQPERCNGLDDDCDGEVDEDAEDAATYYPDTDRDGHGDATADPVITCVAPNDHVVSHDDCDDSRPGVFSGAAELCDAVDNDCDGEVDEQVVTMTFYPDNDVDGYGDERGAPVEGCAPPSGYAPVAGDCDDTDPSVSPVAVERPGDGVDSDCDGYEACYVDRDGDGYYPVDPERMEGIACDAPFAAAATDLPGDCDDTEDQRHPGRAERCDGLDNDCDALTDNGCTCAADEQLCGSVCIAASACCDDLDCVAPQFCGGPGESCRCPDGLVGCGDSACITPDACCTDADCDIGEGYICLDNACVPRIDLDFEAQVDGDRPPFGGVSATGDAWLAVVDGEGTEESRGLCFFDGAGSGEWEPHWYVEHRHATGTYEMEFDVRLEADTQVKLVWRDHADDGGDITGPILTHTTGGAETPPSQGWEQVLADTWYHGQVRILLDARPIRWSYTLTSHVDPTMYEHSARIWTAFENVEVFGITPYCETHALTCFDNIVTRP